jgi:hypothetical protein
MASSEIVGDDGAHCRLCFDALIFSIIAFELCKNAECMRIDQVKNTMEDTCPHSSFEALQREFAELLGYAGKKEIPVALVRKLAQFINDHPVNGMTSFYARLILNSFYRKRTKERSIRLFDLLASLLAKKSALIDLFLEPSRSPQDPVRAECFDAKTIWLAIQDLDDGYGKANCVDRYAHIFTDEIADLAYQSLVTMPDTFKTRALAGIYPEVNEHRKAEILDYVLQQFRSGSSEAAYRLKFMFPFMDRASRKKVVAAHLDLADMPEGLIAYLIIRNAAYFDDDDANKLAARARTFTTGYYRNRCLLKLAAYLPEGEVEELYGQFMTAFSTLPACSALIHSLYHFGAGMKTLDTNRIISQALEKIACLDDSGSEIYAQAKYGEMMFVIPMLTEVHKEQAYSIAETIRGGYKRGILSKLKSHFANSKGYCEIRYAPIFY